MELRALRSRRKAAFWGKVLPYLPYVFQSGVAVLLLLLIIAFSAWYTAFLQNLPPVCRFPGSCCFCLAR